MLTRRSFCILTAGSVGALAGCDASSSKPSTATTYTTPRFTGTARRLATRLGDISLSCANASASVDWVVVTQAVADRVAEVWGPADRPICVRVAADDAEFLSSADGLDDVTGGVTTTDGDVVLSPAVAQGLTRQGQKVLLAHELTHARLGQYGKNPTGMWVREGVAEWTAYQGVSLAPSDRWPALATLPLDQRPKGPPSVSAFSDNPTLAYQQASAFVEYLAATVGPGFVKTMTLRKSSDAQAQHEVEQNQTLRAHPFSQWLTEQLGS